MTDYPAFVAPSFTGLLKRRIAIPFVSAIGASTQLTLVSNPIPFKFKVVNAEISFRDDAASNLRIYVLISNNRNTSTTSVPPDPNVFSSYSPSPYFVGEGIVVKRECAVEAPGGYEYVKVHGNNQNTYVQTINGVVTVEEI